MAANTTGASNTAVGKSALYANTTGADNVAVGSLALDANTTASYNTAVGKNALGANTTGTQNSALGWGAGLGITTGGDNTAIGSAVMYGGAGVTGTDNTGVGREALHTVTSGSGNTSVGNGALKANTTAANNTAVGSLALTANTTGAEAVAIGANALVSATDGGSNVAVGYKAGEDVTTGGNNIFLGKETGRSGSPGGSITTESNEVVMGNNNISVANIQVAWTAHSDKRDKTDVSPLDLGLDFIKKLEPVTYRWDKRSKYSDDQSVTPDGTHKEEQLEGGFLAQDVEVIENQHGYQQSDKTNLITRLSNDGMMYGITYSKLIPMLVKAVQELSAEVEFLKQQKD